MVDRRAALKAKLTEADTHDADMQRLTEMWTQQIALQDEHIDELEDHIKEQLASDPGLCQCHQTMRTAPGMGKVLGVLWVSLHAGQKSLETRKVSSCFGFALHPHRSGSSVRSSEQSSGFGNSEVRKIMHQAALSVSTHQLHYYNRKRPEGKPHLLVINNIINKLYRPVLCHVEQPGRV